MRRLPRVLAYVLLVSVGMLCAGPFIWTLLTALRTTGDVFGGSLIPDGVTLDNFAGVLTAVPVALYTLNSLIVALGSTLLNVLLASLAAFPLARMRFRGRTIVFVAILATMMIPEQVIMIPVYSLLLHLGLLNTLAGVVLPTGISAFGVFLMRQSYRSIPRDMDEAAMIDGCSPLRIWWSVLLPLSAPAVATLAVFTFIGAWSSFLWPLVVLRDSGHYTLTVGLNTLISGFSSDYKYLCAGAIIAMLPVLVVFLAAQKYFVRGVLSGAVKT